MRPRKRASVPAARNPAYSASKTFFFRKRKNLIFGIGGGYCSRMQNQSVLSRTISWLRFPLIVLVVFIHVPWGVEIENFPAASMICGNFVQRGIAAVAVPLFFFISGFLYFYRTEWGVSAYKRKTLKRVRTLVVPFLVWTVLNLVCKLLAYKLEIPSPSAALCAENHSLWDWVVDIFGLKHRDENLNIAFPLYVPFWFLRDLFVVGLLSPLWHFLLKRAGIVALFALGALWFAYQGNQIPGLSTQAIFFFCAGAYFAIHERDFTEDFSGVGVPALALYLPLLAANALTKGAAFNWAIHRAFICVALVAVVFAVSRGIASGKLRESAFLSGAAFFVYAGHGVPIWTAGKRVLALFYVPASDVALVVAFSVTAAFQVGVCLLAYGCVRRWARWSLPFLTGGR